MARQLMDSDAAQRAVKVLRERHAATLRDETFTVSARLEADTVVATVTLARRDRTAVYRVEAAINTSDHRVRSQDEALELALDFLDWHMGEYLRGGRDVLLPLDWQPHRFADHELLARGDLRNEALDDLADAWLRGEEPEIPAHLARTKR